MRGPISGAAASALRSRERAVDPINARPAGRMSVGLHPRDRFEQQGGAPWSSSRPSNSTRGSGGWSLILVFLVIEMLTLDFTFLMLGIGGDRRPRCRTCSALPSGCRSSSPPWSRAVLVLVLRPPLLRRLRRGEDPDSDQRRCPRRPAAGGCCPPSSRARRPGEARQRRHLDRPPRARAATLEPGTVDPREPHRLARPRASVTAAAPQRENRARMTDLEQLHPDQPSDGCWRSRSSSSCWSSSSARSGSSRRPRRASSSASAGTTRPSCPGLNLLVPFIDRVRPLIDMREQVVSFPPQPVITEDNLVVSIDTVIYFQVTDARAATYEIAQLPRRRRAAHHDDPAQRRRRAQPRRGADQPRRDQRPAAHRARRGHRQVGHPRRPRRAEGDRPAAVSIQDSMEKQMRAERDRRALILTAEGTKQSAILDGRGRAAGRDPPRRGRQAGRRAAGPG